MQDGSSKERIDHNNPENDVFVEDIINDQVCRIMEDGGDVELVAYNQLRCDRAKSASIQEIVSLESKYEFRTVAEELGLPVLETHLLPECDSIMDHLRMTHGDGAYVIQNDESSGGDGTFVIDASNARCVESELNRRSGRWIYSRHLKGAVSVNVHLIISDEEVFLTPGSVQICRLIGNRILYRGADFVAYSSLDPEMRCYFDRCARIMGEEIQRRGYRGVAGIDAIFHEGKVALVEANLRYQASTILLNKAMLDASRNDSEWAGVSMHRLNSLARDHKRLSDTISEGKLAGLRVGYSLYTYIAEGDRRGCSGSERENESISLQSRHIFDRLMRMSGCDSDVLRVRQDEWAPESPNGHGSEYVPPNVKSMTLITDGFDGSNDCGPYGYLFKVIINRRILTEGTFEVSPEFSEPEWLAEDLTDPIKLKIALINQGIRVTENVKRDHAFAVNNAIDIKVTLDEGKELWINCPCTDYNVGLSPFELSEMGSGELGITYYGVPLSVKAEWVPESNPGGRNFDVGRGYREDDICVITTDRLRVQQTSRCKFQVMGRPCTFCEVSLDGSPFVNRGHDPLSDFGIEDILSVLSDRLKRNLPDENGHRPLFRHILIGGKTCQSDSQTMEYVDRICDLIRSMSGGEPYDIYLMCTPISSLEDLTALRDMGVVRIGFNKDVIGDSKSAQYTPGKGGLGQDKYLEALKNAVSVFGIGKVYSAMVLGLESPEVYLGWAEQLIDIGAIPILSAYRPVPGTDAAMCGPAIPTNGLLYNVFNHITNCGKGHGGFSDEGAFFADIAPGPSCNACQNNTISLPWTWGESEGCKGRSTREILRDMVDVHYSCNTICKRCGYAALVALILSSSVFLMEIAYGAMWTDSRIDYYSGMIGVTFALAAVSVTGYIFLTEHMGHRAVKDSAFDMAADHFKRDSKSAMSVLLTVSFVFAVMLTVTVFLWIGDDYSPRALSIEYVTLPVLCIVFVTLTAAFVQFDYDLITIDTRITKSARRLEEACRERVNEKIDESKKREDKGGLDRSSSNEEGQTDDLFRKFYEIESIFNSFTDTPKNEQMSIDYRLRYQTQIRDEKPNDNDDIALIDNFFLFREYRDHLLNISRAETYKSTFDKSRTGENPTHHGSRLHQNNIINDEQRKTLKWCIECLTEQMKDYYKDKKIENVNLKKYSFEKADLRNASINSSTLSECVFSRANCKGLKLSNCEIESLKINNADCEGTESTSDEDHPGFDYAIVSGCHISKPELKGVCMKGSDFEDSLILEITMDEVVATSSRYDDVSFVGGSVKDADFENSNFRNSVIICMKIGVDSGEDVRLSLCQMSDCTINEVECVGIDATSLEATQIKLTRVTLRKIWMDKTVLESILLSNSSMLNSNITSCSWGNSKVISSTIGSDEEKPMVIKTSLIRSVEFISVRFTNISMGDVFFENVTFLNCTFDNVDFGNSRFHSCNFEHVYMSKDCNCMDIDMIDCHRARGWLPKEVEKVLTVSKRIRFS